MRQQGQDLTMRCKLSPLWSDLGSNQRQRWEANWVDQHHNYAGVSGRRSCQKCLQRWANILQRDKAPIHQLGQLLTLLGAENQFWHGLRGGQVYVAARDLAPTYGPAQTWRTLPSHWAGRRRDMCVDDQTYEQVVEESVHTNAPLVPQGLRESGSDHRDMVDREVSGTQLHDPIGVGVGVR